MSRTLNIHAIWLGLLWVMLMAVLACSGTPDAPATQTPALPTTSAALSIHEAESTGESDYAPIIWNDDPQALYTDGSDTSDGATSSYTLTLSADYNQSAEGYSGDPFWSGKATPSLSSRIYDADVIVRTTFVSASDGTLQFRVHEYIKGSGTTNTNINVSAPTADRTTTWDTREGILFLNTGASGGASGSAATFHFTPAWRADNYIGELKEGYTIDARNPVWLPAVVSGGASGSSAGAGTNRYIVEAMSPAGVTNPTITLDDLRSEITWQGNSSSAANYDKCVQHAIVYEQSLRDLDAHFGAPTLPKTSTRTHSVEATGEQAGVVHTFTQYGSTVNLYDKIWITGNDADLFQASLVDTDTSPSNGYAHNIEVARPLPEGTYQIKLHSQWDVYQPCNYIPARTKIIWNVNMPATEGVVHEALFDPVALSSGMGADSTNGTLSPANVTIGSTRTSLKGLKWETSQVVLTLTEMVSFAGHQLDFLGTDSASVLTLVGPDATEDNTAKTLTWDVATQPWQAGDKLLLQVTPYTPPPPPDTPTPEPTPSPTPEPITLVVSGERGYTRNVCEKRLEAPFSPMNIRVSGGKNG